MQPAIEAGLLVSLNHPTDPPHDDPHSTCTRNHPGKTVSDPIREIVLFSLAAVTCAACAGEVTDAPPVGEANKNTDFWTGTSTTEFITLS